MTLPTILIVDDEPVIRELLEEVLSDHLRVLAAGSIGEALRILAREAVDAVTCDYRLPDGRGEDVLDWIREHRPALLKRTALLTGADASGIHSRDVMILLKPLSMERLLAVVESWFDDTPTDA